MYYCSECRNTFTRVEDIIVHTKYIHNIGSANFRKSFCPFINCSVQLSSWSGYLRHLKSHDVSTAINVIEVINAVVSHEALESLPTNNNNKLDEDEVVEDISVELGIQIMSDILSSFCSSLLAKGVTNTTVDFVVQELQFSFTQVISLVLKLGKKFCKDDFEFFSCQTKGLMQAFATIKSSYQRQKMFEKTARPILPRELSLGSRTELRVKNNKRQQVIVPDTFMYVPLLKTLESIVNSPKYSKFFINYNSNSHEVNVYKNFSDSKSFKNNILFSKFPNSIQIQLFYDDFETVNPLGSKRGVHKIGGIYFTIRNFPDYINSKLSQIHLLALFYTEDAKKYGMNAILKYLIPDIKLLESSGIKVNGSETIYGTISSLSCDNLGMNSLLGFSESFNSHYYCRICCTSKTEAQEVFDHNLMHIRSRPDYEQHLRQNKFGVQSECALNELQYFDFLNSPSVDIMHDLLEGVVPFEIKIVLQKLISLGCFSLEIVNQRLMAHNYGYLESKNRPNPIRLDSTGHKIGQKAAQAWCLIRHLPVILADLIVSEEGSKYWELIIQLLEIMSLTFCRKFSSSSLQILDQKVMTHHKLFRFLFPHERLIPKHHFMCHYSHVIRQTGPLISLWTMRYEAKHNYFAQLAAHIKNFRNICYSLAFRHQQYSAFMMQSSESSDSLKTDHIFIVNLSNFVDSFDLIESLRLFDCYQNCDGETQIYTTNQIWYRGYNYKTGFVVCYEMGNVFPKFGIINEFLLPNDKTCYLLLKELDVEYFDRHYFAFKVKHKIDIFKVISITDLVVHDCFEIQRNCSNESLYLVLRHHL